MVLYFGQANFQGFRVCKLKIVVLNPFGQVKLTFLELFMVRDKKPKFKDLLLLLYSEDPKLIVLDSCRVAKTAQICTPCQNRSRHLKHLPNRLF